MRLKNKKPLSLAKDLNLSQTTVYKWVSGERVPRYDSIKLLAEYFQCDVSELTENPHDNETKTTGKMIPVLGVVAGGFPIYAEENIIDYEEISLKLASSGEYFALVVKGDSMSPRMQEGDIVIVKKQDTIECGQIGIVLVNGDEATVKRVIFRPDGIELHGFNPSFTPLKYTTQEIMSLPVKIIGRVVECRSKF